MNTNKKIFGKNLRQLRVDNGLTQAALGRKAGVTEAAICRYESGQRLPQSDIAINLTLALGCTLDDLFKNAKGTDK